MTFAEWRDKYPRVVISQPHTEALDVYLICGRDPLNDGGGTTWDPPMFELFALSDYMVTTDNVHRGTVWIAPRVERDDWTRADYMASRCSHDQYYQALARLIGLETIQRMILSYVAPLDRLRDAFEGDQHMNRIPLARWDRMDPGIRDLVSSQNKSKNIMGRSWCGQPLKPGTVCWSLSESVCVAKAAARLLIDERAAVCSVCGRAAVRRAVDWNTSACCAASIVQPCG